MRPSVDVLLPVKDNVGLDTDAPGQRSATFLYPGTGTDLFVSLSYSGSGGEGPRATDVIDDAVAGLDALNFTAIFGFEALLGKAQITGNIEVPLAAINHPEVMGHRSNPGG